MAFETQLFDAQIQLNKLIYIVFVLDIGINLNTSVNLDGHEIFKRKDITVHYLKTWFIFDLLAVLPFTFLFPMFDDSYQHFHQFFKLFRLFRLLRVSYLGQFGLHYIDPVLIRLATFTLWVFHFTHWVACGWYKIGGVTVQEDILTGYLRSLYWAVATLTTVGYGDIVPKTNLQTVYAMGTMLIGVAIYAYVIGNIATVLTHLNMANVKLSSKLEEMNAFFRYKKIPKEFQRKVNDYYHYILEHGLVESEHTILNDLPRSFREEAAMYLNKEFVEKVPLFEDASEDLIRDMVLKLKPALFAPNDTIFKYGDDATSLYFINKGLVEIYLQDDEMIASLSDGSFFGEMALFTNRKRSATAITKSYCEIHILDEKSFRAVINRYPTFAKKVKRISEKREIKRDFI